MANLTIRDFPDDLRDRLRVQATRHGRSMAAEAMRLLIIGLSAEPRADSEDERAVHDVQAWVATQMADRKAASAAMCELVRDRRREVIAEVIAEGRDPASYFGSEFARICQEAGWSEADVRQLADRRE